MKLIYVVIDGMGDLPIGELGNRTPLAAAGTPHMDLLAMKGKTGLMYTVGKGIAPESDVAVVSILGYDPVKYAASRGVMEAVGSGIVFQDGDLALRCNFATFGPRGTIIDRRAGRNLTTEDTAKLGKEINQQVRLETHPASFELKNTAGHRAALVIRGENVTLSGSITNTDPAYKRIDGMGVANPDAAMVVQECEPIEETLEARISAELVNEFVEKSHEVLRQSEVNARRLAEGRLSANGILTRDAGHRLPGFFDISERYNVKFCSLTNMSLEVGIARLVGMNPISFPPPSGNLEEDCKIGVKALLGVLESYDGFYIHIKGPDEPGHDGDYPLKTEMIATIDKYFFGGLLSQISLNNALFCVTADHATPCTLKAHSDDPVPLLISGNNIRGDDVSRFSEASCRGGSLGLLEHGYLLMPQLMKFLNQTQSQG